MIEEKKNKLSKATVKIDFNLAPGLNSLGKGKIRIIFFRDFFQINFMVTFFTENVIEEFSDNFVTAFKTEAEKRAKIKSFEIPLK